MADDNPLTVFVAEKLQTAEAVVELLAKEGLAAELVAPPPKADPEPVLGGADLVTSDAIEVRVADEKQAEKAREVLGTAIARAKLQALHEKRAARTGTVTAACEECGKTSEWPASAMGTTETCPHCTAYMDIPDPDDDWSGVDVGDAEEDDDGDETEEGTK
ncbi:Uncharacterized protein OS=Planctomyces brasiliensis (strain ATCC 49424 / DSM 5305 / JCM 21570 / NBRC 103401 / IFAM 1448) GN=Plabr_2832 PE=4 SV=1 [Gemmataceae bacterium]|nr:Uncharacterized protein OS=Planctomyces brasiliensis (strain ATCC 49424 / DSM 5305 / JCM 21570 / NBRC 103401 / IFAM 1448) GN=Plabr_2832 PE=4 SV=1 [Gemmataceae bacterium]VTT96381.1 Uncharacterized protein OS=Planctomyces brasiliensis (strain ATCC 49424 / DSM 5305 / JCM 21570 / NBRC 103401 / IFAM 1448) GN=Plabr_2832 PE=4 SV=1 [Gemmataceae bacterium]